MKKAIANTTVISNFAAVHRLDLLQSLLAARAMAKKWKIELSGTLGVLVRCVEIGLLTLEEGNAPTTANDRAGKLPDTLHGSWYVVAGRNLNLVRNPDQGKLLPNGRVKSHVSWSPVGAC